MRKVKDKILVITIIIFSILGVTYKVLADGPIPLQGTPQHAVPWYENAGFTDGIVKYEGGDSRTSDDKADSGTLHFGLGNSSGTSSSGGGGFGGGGSWNGSVAGFPEYVSSPASSYSPGGKGEIWFDEVCSNIDVLCTQQGVGITGKNLYIEDDKAVMPYWETRVEEYEDPRFRCYSEEDAIEAIRLIAEADKKESEYQEFYRTSSKYSGSSRNCTPAEAFVLSEASNISGSGENTPLQSAWWAVTGTGSGGNEISEGAFAFQNYVNGSPGGEVTTYTTNDGTFTGFPIKFEPEFANTDYTVSFNEANQQYIIGPLKIDYYQCEPFAFMNNIDIYADNSETAIPKEEYYIALDSGNGNLNKIEDGVFPANGEDFYIILNYNENYKKITNIKADFQYMNGGGSYTYYTGTYTKVCIQGHIYGQFDYPLFLKIVEFRNWLKRQIADNRIMFIYYGGGAYNHTWGKSLVAIQRMLIANPASYVDSHETRVCPSELLGTITMLYGDNRLSFSEAVYRTAEKIATQPEDERVEGQEDLYRGWEKLYNSGKPTDRSHAVPDPLVFDVWKDLEYINMGEETAQAQSVSGGAARWWEYKTIEWTTNLGFQLQGQLEIKKAMEGEAKDGDVFEFEVQVGSEPTERLQITYKNGGDNSVKSKVYTWDAGTSAPTYEVREISKNGYTLGNTQSITGTLGDGKTIEVNIQNVAKQNNGTLEISKEIQKSNLDTKEYTLENKIFKFNVILSGNCEVSYNGQNYTVTKDNSLTLPIEIRAVSEGASQSEKDSALARISVKWYQDVPKYKVEEVSNEANNSSIAGSSQVQITPSQGELCGGQVVKVKAENELIQEKSKIRIIKTLENYEKLSQKELEKLKFEFKVNVYSDQNCTTKLKNLAGEEYKEEIVEAKISRTDDGKWNWIGTTNTEYIWAYGNYPYFKIEETNTCPLHGESCQFKEECTYVTATKFDKSKTQAVNSGDASLRVNDSGVTGKLNKNSVTTGVFDCKIVNKLQGQKEGTITINKKVDTNVLKRQDFKFIVKIKGTFEYNGTLYKDKTIQLTTNTNKCNELSSIDEYNDKDFVIINLEGNGEKIWKSDKITWYGEAPYYSVEEYTAGLNVTDENGIVKEVNVSGVPQKGCLNEDESVNNVHNITVTAKNSVEDINAGYVKIIKTLENSEKCSVDYIKSVRFKFKVKVFKTSEANIVDERIVELGNDANQAVYDEQTNTWKWEWISPKYSWRADENALKYSVEEINEFPVGVSFKEVQGDNPDQSNRIVTGSLKDSGEETDPEKNNDEIKITTDAVFINKVDARHGLLQIQKKLVKSGLNLAQFKFKVTLKGTFYYGSDLKSGTYEFNVDGLDNNGTWTSEDISWYGDAPTYIVEEIENDVSNLVSMQNNVGIIKSDNTVIAKFINEGKPVGGHLKVTKTIVGNGIPIDEKFRFKVTIKQNGKDLTNYISIKANETWTSDYIRWYDGDQVPTYTVEEIELPEGAEFVEIRGESSSGKVASGSLLKNKDATVVATNRLQEKKGRFSVGKKVIFNKLIDTATTQIFTMDIKIIGTFKVEGRSVNNSSYSITTELKADETYTSPEITWYGDNAPVITVTERVKEGWDKPVYSNNGDTGAKMLENQTLGITVTNRINVEIDLMMNLAGKVWEDEPQDPESKNTPDSVPNGLIDGSEKGLDGVEVYVYRVITQNGREIDRSLAVAHSDVYNSGMQNPVITSGGGNWQISGLSVTGFTQAEKSRGYSTNSGCKVKYDVEFVYDGQTYEPTKVLSYKSGNGYSVGSVQDYVGENPSNRVSKYGNSSFALDFDREQVNDRIREIYGKTPIDGSGNTISTINGSEGAKDVYYKASVPANENTRIESILQTTKESGIAYDLYKAKARTSTAGLEFPVDSSYKLEYTNTTYTLNGVTQTYNAIYGHCLHINLGLVKRAKVDLEASKDLYSAKVVLDGKELNYRFNKLSDLILKATKGEYNRVSDYKELDSIKYELGLYRTDYYYRAEIYKGNAEVYDSVQDYYINTFGKILEDSEMKVYLTYKINLYNNSSQTYKVKINGVDDYVESSLGMPISTEIKEVINEQLQTVAIPSYSTNSEKYVSDEGGVKPNDAKNVEWQLVESNIKGSDGVVYNKFKTKGNLDFELNSGANKYIYVTFAVQKDTIDNVERSIILGNKSNIVEIANYSTYYTDGRVAGKLDIDSAPSNVNIRDYNNEKTWYEDDTAAAPTLNLKLIGEEKEVSGIAWEDSSKNQGIRDDDEALIGGLTTELIEKIKMTTSSGVTEYDFLWPTYENLDCLGGKTLEYLTGFDSITETSRTLQKAIIDGEEKIVAKVGGYKFTGIPAGEYVVRFLYGNDKTQLEDTKGITLKPAQALTENGTPFAEGKPNYNENILIANYDGDKKDSTEAIYNGQDYKSTIYQEGCNKTSEADSNKTPIIDGTTGYLSNEYHDLANKYLSEAKVSDARDSEYRRLDIIANSETITNSNSSVLSSANDLSENHKKLYSDYGMFADTAKIKLNITSDNGLPGVETTTIDGTVLKAGSVIVDQTYTKYNIENVDFGLIERPETSIVLDKQISGIKLTTNDEKVIFEALYDISYETIPKSQVNNDRVIIADLGSEYLVAKVELNKANSKGIDQLQAINRNEVKPTNASATGIQNFRFINVDAEILQGTTIELTYLITALNIGEVDYTSAELERITDNREDNCSSVIKTQIKELANMAKEYSRTCNINFGKYLGTNYYTGKLHVQAGGVMDKVVSSKVRQVIDYVDNDGVFTPEYNTENNHMWRNASITELTGNGQEVDRILDKSIVPEYEILDKKNISYITPQKNNVVLSTDLQKEVTGTNTNSGFESKLVPYISDQTTDKSAYRSQIILTVTRTVSAGVQDSADNLTYDNLTEIVKFENSVGRRDVVTTAGNANPKFGEFITSLEERDTSATELVTFTPPTGIEVEAQMTTQVLIIVIGAIGVVVLGIIVLKKKVLTNR